MDDFPTGAALLSSALAGVAVFLAALWVGPAWDALAERRQGDLIPRLRALGLDDQGVRRALRYWGIGLFATFVVFGVFLAMPPVAVGLTYLVFVLPTFILQGLVRRRAQTLRDQMTRAAAGLANTARAGLSLPQGLARVADETPAPLGRELQRIVSHYQAGAPLVQAMREVQQRLDIEAFTMFSSAITVAIERGGKVMEALDRISESLHEMQRLERKLESDSAAGRKLAMVLGMFPLFFLLLFSLLDPEGMSFLYNTLLGQFVLLGVGALIYLAVRWCMAILDVDF
ncbi:MAG TPA: type II secretion system F family protein [Lacipirellulaceae bacterium]|nr:type II secretion system F family protein [Lacipirellulaceae bacterium]